MKSYEIWNPKTQLLKEALSIIEVVEEKRDEKKLMPFYFPIHRYLYIKFAFFNSIKLGMGITSWLFLLEWKSQRKSWAVDELLLVGRDYFAQKFDRACWPLGSPEFTPEKNWKPGVLDITKMNIAGKDWRRPEKWSRKEERKIEATREGEEA